MEMATATIRDVRPSTLLPGLPPTFKKEGVVYAVAFDMDIEQLRMHYGDPYNNASLEIRRVLEEHQFQWQQGSVYFGGSAVTAASLTVAVIDLTTRLPWFAASVRDIRMLRIEESNDLMPVVQRVAGLAIADDNHQ
jgi:virulence-associated protein VapD